jgi:capsule polysaccharide export protein KpsE/RkpR
MAGLGQLGSLAALAGQNLGLKSPTDLYIGLLKSRSVADALIPKFELTKVYRERSIDKTRKDLAGYTEITAGKDGIITVSVLDKDPKRAAAMANAYVDALQNLNSRLAVTEASQRRVFFEHQVDDAKEKLAQAENQFKDMQVSTGMIQLPDQSRLLIQNVERVRVAIAAAEIELTRLKTFATDENAEVIATERQLSELRHQLAEAQKADTGGDGDVSIATARVPQAGLEYARKYRDLKYADTLYELLSQQLELARVDEARSAPLVQTLDLAVVPDQKAEPHRLLIVVTLTVVAFFIAVVVVFAREQIISATNRYEQQTAELRPPHSEGSAEPSISQ